MNIVFLDTKTVGETDLSILESKGNLIKYIQTEPHQIVERCVDAEVVIINKVNLFRAEIEQLPKLKLICIAATGMNNVDLAFAAEKGIAVKNVANYSTNSVAETTFSLALGLIHHTHYYDTYVKSGDYSNSDLFTHHGRPFFELNEKNWGIIGLGNIGKKVAHIAEAFGAQVSYYSTSGKNLASEFQHKSLDKLLAESDVISIHAPLNAQTANLLKYSELSEMKPTALLINVGRGGIVDEADLARILREDRIAGTGFDVFADEPMKLDNPLLAQDIAHKLLLAPHIAWASMESRRTLIEKIAQNIQQFVDEK
ncbi:MAG: D-2-hydroxyacid dehydrogenase [Bacteroidales bacterium]|nr:D-2-hydroxyacid dehydrogenase [Bacteroidales bacterium]